MEQKKLTEYGGYLPLELPFSRSEYYPSDSDYAVYDFNCGRTAILYALDVLAPKRVFIPHYYCPSVKKALSEAGFNIVFYSVDFNLRPVLHDQMIDEDDAVVLVNYFGITDVSPETIGDYSKVVIDNCLAFYEAPLLRDGVINIYSCRKFFGVSDGAYAIGLSLPEPDYPLDKSCERAIHLLSSIDLGTNGGYRASLANERALGEDRKRMSLLTHRILSSIDYQLVQERRKNNYRILHDELSIIQLFDAPESPNTAYCYPLLLDRQLRKALVERHIYVARFWEDWLGTERANTPQWVFSNYLMCLPIDQRYSEEDMKQLAKIVISTYERSIE